VFAAGCRQDHASNQPADNAIEGISMNDAWTRIHSWLSANAPKISRSLNAGASASQLATTEEALGREMPAEWRELYQTHNGMSNELNLGSLFYSMRFLTLDEAAREHSNSNTEGVAPFPVRASDPGIKRADMCNPNWIAFASAGGDTLLCVDTDPATGGTVGQVIFTDHADNTVLLLATSLSQFLGDFARDLEGGKYSLNQESLADGNEFLNCSPDIDVLNWHRTQRWKHFAY